jgi:hypothetical protein
MHAGDERGVSNNGSANRNPRPGRTIVRRSPASDAGPPRKAPLCLQAARLAVVATTGQANRYFYLHARWTAELLREGRDGDDSEVRRLLG